LTNTASLTANATADPGNGNNSSTSTTTVTRSADLQVTKTAAPDPATPGSTETFTINVKNVGPSDNGGYSLTDNVPPGTTFVSASTGCTQSSGTVTCTSSGLTPGATDTYTVVVQISSGFADGGTLTNTAAITTNPTTDPDHTNDSSTSTTTVTRKADLSVTKTDGVTSVTAGDGVTRTYTITVTNNGPSDASGVTLSDMWPAGFNRGTITGATCSGSPSFTCNLGTIATGGTATVSVSYTVPSSTTGDQTNKATVASDTSDTTPSNNSATDTDTVSTAADLSITKASSAASVVAGDPAGFDYTFTVHNAGPSDNGGYHVTDTLPTGVTFVSGANCSATGQVVTCSAPSLGANAADKVFTVHVKVAASVAEGVTLSNTATVVSDSTTDPVSGNNSSTVTTLVHASADVSITKDDGVTNVVAGDGVNHAYTIKVTNAGPSDAANVSVTDTWPAGFTRGTVTATQGTCAGSPGFTCTIGTVAAGGSVTITANYTVPSTTNSSQTNTATVTSPTDTATGNNSASDTDTVTFNRPPNVDAGPNASGQEGSAIALDGTVTDPDGDTFTVVWTYTAGAGVDLGATCTFGNAALVDTTITCTDDGTYTVKLEATDSKGGKSSDTATVTVSNANPVVTAPNQTPAPYSMATSVGVTVNFTDAGANDTHKTPPGGTCTVSWDDATANSTGTVTEPVGANPGTCTAAHMYTTPGVYTVTITVTDDDGGSYRRRSRSSSMTRTAASSPAAAGSTSRRARTRRIRRSADARTSASTRNTRRERQFRPVRPSSSSRSGTSTSTRPRTRGFSSPGTRRSTRARARSTAAVTTTSR